MAIYRLHRQQWIPASVSDVWEFFSNAGNLAAITPQKMGFKVTSGDLPQGIYPGQIITYKVSPLLGIPLFWMTEITAVQEGKLFVDEQRRGPYNMWHHQHHFEEKDGGVLMTDIVHYEVPLGPLGRIANGILVRGELEKIFNFRAEAVAKRFGGTAKNLVREIRRLG